MGITLLYEWVKNLADVYEVSYKTFCHKVLKLTSDETFDLISNIPEKALIILSHGFGIPICDLRGRDLNSRYKN